jgi:sigma-B regulation protein RsbU (phosphoserine phosphatase)
MFSPYYSSDDSSFKFILDILDGMHDWVRVVDRNNSVIFMNRSMEEGLKIEELAGKKCYELLGRDIPCENCITRKVVFEGKTFKKEEVCNNRTYSVMSSPIIADDGNIHYAVEVLRDITKEKELETRILKQNLKLQQDLEMARKLQMQLLPRDIQVTGVDFAYRYHPCDDLSGDMVNLFQIDKDHIGLYIADVSGHGVSASMLTVFLISVLSRRVYSPARALYRLFRQFNAGDFDKNSYITVFYAIYNLKTRLLTYANAGHNCIPIICGPEGVKRLFMPGIPISDWLDKPQYRDASVNLNLDERLFLYTDGVTDQWLGDPDKLIEDNYVLSILKDRHLDINISLNLISRYIYHQLDAMNVRQKDDITMALIQPVPRKAPHPSKERKSPDTLHR